MNGTTIIGLVRDLVGAVLGLALAFGVSFSDDQTAGIVLVATTLTAFVVWVWQNRGDLWTGWETGLGLFRDTVQAALGVLILLGVAVTTEQVGGILTFISVLAAVIVWAVRSRAGATPA